MAELTVSQIIKITLGLFVVVAVVAGAGMFFKDKIAGFFGGLSEDDNSTSGEVNLSGYVPETQKPVLNPVLLSDAHLMTLT